MIDIDSNELEKPTINPDLAIAGRRAPYAVPSLLPATPPLILSGWNVAGVAAPKFAPDSRAHRYRRSSDTGSIYPLCLIRMLSELGTKDVIVADGGGRMYTLLALRFKMGQRLISSTGLELPGFALAGAIGASIATDQKPVICLCEDRGFQISIQDLQSVLDYQLPIKVLLLKSKGHSIVRNIQRDYFGGRFVGTDHDLRLGSAPLIQITRVFGIPTFEASRVVQLPTTLRAWLQTAGPAVCEVEIEDDKDRTPRPGFTIRDGGKWIAKPLEDMSPLLDRKTLLENMIIDLMQED